VADLWGKPEVQAALEAARQKDPKQEDPAARMERETGLKPGEVERAHLVILDAAQDQKLGWVVVRTVKPYDRDRILSHLKDRAEKRHKDRRYYLSKNEQGQEVAVHFGGPRVIVVCDREEAMKRCMELAEMPVKEGPLAATVKQADEGKSQVVVGLRFRGGLTEVVKNAPQAGMVKDKLDDLDVVRITADVGKDVDLDVRVVTTDEAAAMRLQAALNNLQKQTSTAAGKLTLAFIGLGMGLDGNTMSQITKVLAAMKPEVQGNEVSVKARTDTSTLVAGLIALAAKQTNKKEGSGTP